MSPSARGALRDGLIIAVAAFLTFDIAATFDLFNIVVGWAQQHRDWRLAELFAVAVVSDFILGVLLLHRGLDLRREMAQRRQMDEALQSAHERLTSWVGELEQRDRQNALLNEMGDLLQACHSLEELSAVVARSAQHLFPLTSGGLFVLRPSRDLLEATNTWGEHPPAGETFGPADCWALRRGRVHAVSDPSSGPHCKHLSPVSPTNYLCVPLAAQGDMFGVLHLAVDPAAAPREESAQPIAQTREQLATMVGERIALQMANLRLRQTLRDQAIRDPLTGLFNRRYMEETLERELYRCARATRPLSVVMLDVDHFKRFNDLHGHGAGDAVLAALGNYLRTHVRREDIACRFGGEEFALILPDADLEAACGRAEEICLGLRQLALQYRDQPLTNVSVSLGVAAFPQHAGSAEGVMRAADEALYAAKSAGRDQVVVAAAEEGLL
ncbi:MAG: sensor domain-containing diguanylate cyclase [Chloroflexota bacterium]